MTNHLALLLVLLLPVPLNAADQPPNILFILTDDHRFDALGCMGNEIIKTPHIDALAADGVIFNNAFTTTSICSISRASYLLGQYERRHRCDSFRKPLSDEQWAASFPAILRRAGYRTGFIGKWGIGGDLPTAEYDYWQGFAGQGSYFPKGEEGTGKHLTDVMGEQAIWFLDGCTPDQPWLLQLSTKAAHCQDNNPWPFQSSPHYSSRYADVTIPSPPLADEEHFALLPELLQNSEGRTRWHVRHSNPELNQKSLKDYYRLITQLDDWVGELRTVLARKGMADNTVIIYTADNGMFLGDRGLADKWFMYEESIRIPLIVLDPRLPLDNRGRRSANFALNIDIAPTILELAGLRVEQNLRQGMSLVPLLQGKNILWRGSFLYEHRIDIPTIPKSEGVRTTRWKYVRYTESDPLVEQLFDLKTDPNEEHDLAQDPAHQTQLQSMRDKWQVLCKASE